MLDMFIPALFAAYGVATITALLQGEDSLPHSRLENGRTTVLVWGVVAIALVISAGTDIIIAVRLAAGDAEVVLWLPSLVSSATLLMLGAVGLSHAIESQSSTPDERSAYSDQEKERDQAIVNKLDAYIEANKPYLDPDLTLARLARRLKMPQKQLSSAINKATGNNVALNKQPSHPACVWYDAGRQIRHRGDVRQRV